MDATRKTDRIEHVDLIADFEHRTWPAHVAPAALPSFTPTKHVYHVDILWDYMLNKYLAETRMSDARVKTLKKLSLQATLREIAGY